MNKKIITEIKVDGIFCDQGCSHRHWVESKGTGDYVMCGLYNEVLITEDVPDSYRRKRCNDCLGAKEVKRLNLLPFLKRIGSLGYTKVNEEWDLDSTTIQDEVKQFEEEFNG